MYCANCHKTWDNEPFNKFEKAISGDIEQLQIDIGQLPVTEVNLLFLYDHILKCCYNPEIYYHKREEAKRLSNTNLCRS